MKLKLQFMLFFYVIVSLTVDKLINIALIIIKIINTLMWYLLYPLKILIELRLSLLQNLSK